MPKSDLKKLEIAFRRAVSLSGDRRDAFLGAFASRYPELTDKLRSLLASDHTGDDVLADPIEASVVEAAGEREDSWVDRTVGSWRIIERIGSGGMGTVYMAQRASGDFNQIAALKIMAGQHDDELTRRRFAAERQILADLEHPGIARLIDGGLSDTHALYLVMELVEGEHIDRFCDSRKLTVQDRIGLIIKVCDATDYAHRNLVIHRDIKPSNILVDETGHPKLLDFGVAKLLKVAEDGTSPEQTLLPQMAMTPEYASPEQIRGETASVAVDVYSLGVLLYRLLTGYSPYGKTTHSYHELHSAILHDDPVRPSKIAATDTQVMDGVVSSSITGSSIGENRQVTPERLRRTIAGDLDTIILKCLQKEPERRYRSVHELREDLARYLNGLPILARGDDTVYRFRRFATRNARALTSTAVGLAALVGLTGFYTTRLAYERDRAELAAMEAQQVSGFLQSVFAGSSAYVAQGDQVTARDLLSEGERRIAALEGQNELQATFAYEMAESYHSLGLDGDAERLVNDALAYLEGVEPDPAVKRADIISLRAEMQRVSGEYNRSLETHRQARALYAQALGELDPRTINMDVRTAAVLGDQNKCEESLAIREDAYAKLIAAPNRKHEYELDTLGGMAVCLDTLGRYEEAAELGRELVERSTEFVGADDPNTIIRIHNLGLVLRRQWKLDEAIEQFEIADERGSRVWPDESPHKQRHLVGHAIALEVAGDFERSRELRQQFSEIVLRTHGEGSPAHVEAEMGIARWNSRAGNLEAAIKQYTDLMPKMRQIHGSEGFFTTLTELFFAIALRLDGSAGRAEALLRRVDANSDVLNASLAKTMTMQKALVAAQTGRRADALSYLDELGATRNAARGEDGPGIVSITTDIADTYLILGDFEAAAANARKAYDAGREGLPEGNWNTALAGAKLALALEKLGREEEARVMARQCYRILASTFGQEDYRARSILSLASA